MNILKSNLSLLLFIFQVSIVSHATMLPENNLRIPVTESVVDKKKFNELIDLVVAEYAGTFPIYGAKGFNVFREWENERVNAATRKKNGFFEMIVYGGLARYAPLSEDAFVLVLCHEIGHLIGGAPTFKPQNDGSSEGQADYFSTSKCFRRVFAGQDHQEKIKKLKINQVAKLRCSTSYSIENDRLLCLRSSAAIESMAHVLKELGELPVLPKFETPDPYRRMFTLFNGYPSEQCRIDTLLAGATCPLDPFELMDLSLYNKGNCTLAESYTYEARPRCWYVPKED